MADGHARHAALRLRGFAGIGDDEGIEYRERAEHRFGETRRRQRDRVAGQPFQRAVGTEMQHGIRLDGMLEP